MTDHVKALRDIAENPEPMDEADWDVTDFPPEVLQDLLFGSIEFAWYRINGGMHPK